MFQSICIIYLAAQAFSTAALPQSRSCYSLVDDPAVAVDQNTLHFLSGCLLSPESACTKAVSSEGGTAQTQPQQEEEEGTSNEMSKVTSQSSDEDDYILDESGCPELTKNIFYCMMCGGSDEHGRCKGDPEYNNEFKGCDCTPDPDWSVNPPGLVRPQIREHRQAIRDRHLLRDDEGEGSGSTGNVLSSAAATVAVSTRLPLATKSALLHFASKQ